MAYWPGMGEARVALGLDGPVAHIVLARPEARNAFDGPMVRELRDAVRAASAREEIRVIVLAGRGAVFCAGADIEWMKTVAGSSREENLADAGELVDLFETIDRSPKAVVACVQGAALGGGAGLVAVADIAVAEEGARFGFSEVRLGLVPSVISPYVVRKIGASAARELFLTGERFTAARAAEIGLVHRVVPLDELDAAVDDRVRELLQAAPGALAAAKNLVHRVQARPVEGVRELTIETIAERRASAEGQEGLLAFLEKRKPDWAE
ncbi:MAG TPA: enoyl-CoA hydratase-related protein [Vicinamibacteria bacterium]|nr:enoyl-CoA hydratase-related protein [Vicinamibacteria bacterium]